MKSTAASEEATVRALRSGDSQAFCRVYDDYHASIYNLCARIVGDREEAKDLTQEVFLRAFSSPPEHRSGSGLRPWLYRVATNLCLNHLRAGRGRATSTGEEIEEVAAPVDAFQQAQTVALVEATLGQLNDRYRAALVLKDLHGLPSDELAGVMETSRASADVLVHRARASFRSVFTRLAGDGAPVPGSLALVLAPLAVPAALQIMPPLPPAPPLHVPASPAPAPHASASHAPTPHAPMPPHPALPLDGASSGLLNKLATAVGSKVAIAAAAAGLITGGVAVERIVTDSRQDAAKAETVAAATVNGGSSSLVSSSVSVGHLWTEHWARLGCLTGDPPCDSEHVAGGTSRHDGFAEADHVTARDGGAGSGHGTTTHDATGTGGTGSAHDATGSGSTGTHDSTTGTGGAGSHDSAGGTTKDSGTGDSGGTGGEH